MSLEMEAFSSEKDDRIQQKSDLETMRDMSRNLSAAIKGLENALDIAKEEDRNVLESMLESVQSFQQNLSKKAIGSETYRLYELAMSTVRSELKKHLPPSKMGELFGPDNLA